MAKKKRKKICDSVLAYIIYYELVLHSMDTRVCIHGAYY